MKVLEIIKWSAWLIWLVSFLATEWNNKAVMYPLGFCLLACIPFLIIACKFWMFN